MTKQIIRFLFVGGLGFGTNYLLFVFFVLCLNIGVVASTVIAFLAAAFQNYVLNSRFTFDAKFVSKVSFLKSYLYFLVGAISGLLVNLVVVLLLGPSIANIYIVQFIALVVVSIFNYLYSKSIVFRCQDRR